jgi:endonuclease III
LPSTVSKTLRINLASRREEEAFKWFLACLLFGKPIQQEIAERAFARLVAAGLYTPEAILAVGWDELVRLLDEAHYVRYDFSTASKLLEVCQELKQRFGSVTTLIEQAGTAVELRHQLQTIQHIGPVTARIFTREVEPIWYGSRASPGTGRKRQSSSLPRAS